MQLGGNDNAGEIFITFLLRYGASSPQVNSSASKMFTPLRNGTVVRTAGHEFAVGVADMGGVYKLQNCLLVFQACYMKLRDKLKKCSTDPSHSILGYIVDSRWLKSVREKYETNQGGSPPSAVALGTHPSNPSVLVPGRRQFAGADNDSPLHAKTRATKRKSEAMVDCRQSASKQTGRKRLREECEADTDDEAEQLKAGYGLQGVVPQKNQARSSTKKTRGKRRQKHM